MSVTPGALISFAGLPGTGKSTIAMALSVRIGAVYLRIDEIEAAIIAEHPGRKINGDSYHIAAALAASNLQLGHTAIVDCVNPWPMTRDLFAAAATRAQGRLLAVELYCADEQIHRRRIESRKPDIPSQNLPDWRKVLERDYTPWEQADLRIDTASTNVDEAVAIIAEML